MVLIEELEWLKNDDTLFHYTKATTAIFHILTEMRLLFNKFSNLSDIRESIIPHPIISMWIKENKDFDEALIGNRDELNKRLENGKKCKRVACFCSNTTKIIDNPLKFDTCFDKLKDEDKYIFENKGCFKSRMWDQYAEGYKGVCLVFSKESLIKSLKESNITSHYGVQINYTASFHFSFSLSEDFEIELNKLLDYRIEHKSIDYKGESEFRFVVNIEEDDKDFYLNISDSLKAIIIGPLFPKSQIKLLKCLLKTNNNNIKLLEYKINNNFDDEIWVVKEND